MTDFQTGREKALRVEGAAIGVQQFGDFVIDIEVDLSCVGSHYGEAIIKAPKTTPPRREHFVFPNCGDPFGLERMEKKIRAETDDRRKIGRLVRLKKFPDLGLIPMLKQELMSRCGVSVRGLVISCSQGGREISREIGVNELLDVDSRFPVVRDQGSEDGKGVGLGLD